MEKERKEERPNEGGITEIAYQNKDIVSKVMAEEFKGKSFAVYGVDLPRIIKVEPTNLPVVEANELRMDNLFYLEDGSYLLVDYESIYDVNNMFKYFSYVVRTAKRLYNEDKEVHRIKMLVIYTADVKRGTTNPNIDIGCCRFEIIEAFLSELNYEDIWCRVSDKLFHGLPLDPKEVMELIVYPLIFENNEDKRDAITRTINLVNEIENDKTRTFIFKCLMVFTDKIIRDEDAKRIKEAIMLTKVEKLIYKDVEEEVSTRIAKKLLESGSSVDYVAENTGVPLDTVIKLYNSIVVDKQ